VLRPADGAPQEGDRRIRASCGRPVSSAAHVRALSDTRALSSMLTCLLSRAGTRARVFFGHEGVGSYASVSVFARAAHVRALSDTNVPFPTMTCPFSRAPPPARADTDANAPIQTLTCPFSRSSLHVARFSGRGGLVPQRRCPTPRAAHPCARSYGHEGRFSVTLSSTRRPEALRCRGS
jgi:hypothetical protein